MVSFTLFVFLGGGGQLRLLAVCPAFVERFVAEEYRPFVEPRLIIRATLQIDVEQTVVVTLFWMVLPEMRAPGLIAYSRGGGNHARYIDQISQIERRRIHHVIHRAAYDFHLRGGIGDRFDVTQRV